MQSIIDILHKNFQEDHINSRRFPGYPAVVDILVYTVNQKNPAQGFLTIFTNG